MDRRNALLTLGSAAICSFAGCSSKDDSESVAPPPLTEIILWSVLETGESVSAKITVEKDGSQIFETVHEFEGENRFSLTKDWMGDAVPYSVTIELVSTEGTDTYSSSDFSHDSNDCWILYGDLGSSSVFLGGMIGEEHC
ncbi:hypothetical protein [Natrinema limicola]|uniref:hypothetical protein n=1 Tax=Natrinema limicola TaxID=370323 RepID=UPI0012677911|nr:hypothetical protein [Natrinema limicola]